MENDPQFARSSESAREDAVVLARSERLQSSLSL